VIVDKFSAKIKGHTFWSTRCIDLDARSYFIRRWH